MQNQTDFKKNLLDQFDEEFFGDSPQHHNQTLNKVGKVNVGWNLNYLKTLPDYDMLVDVGAANDFHTLHAANPKAYSMLIDANARYTDEYNQFLQTTAGEYWIGAVGEKPGVVQYKHYKDHPYYSTTQQREQSPGGEIEMIELEMKTIDSIVPLERISTGALMKLDIEGSELAALKGATKLLEKTHTVICEMSLDSGFPGGESFHSVYTLLINAGFSLRDIVRVPRLHHNSFPAQVIDGVFSR